MATKSNGLTVLKIVAAFQDEEENNSMSPSGLPGRVGKLQVFHHLREITAQVLMTLAVDRSLHDILIAEPIVNILILFLNQSIGFGFHCALEVSNTWSRDNRLYLLPNISYPHVNCYLFLKKIGMRIVCKLSCISCLYGG